MSTNNYGIFLVSGAPPRTPVIKRHVHILIRYILSQFGFLLSHRLDDNLKLENFQLIEGQ